MNTYDFLVLSPSEFEIFTRDLLQKKLGVFIESFTSGRDGGIDLRCAKDSSRKVIIQAKRYSNLSSLMSNLKKEVEKVKTLKPDRYILSTTVGLTPDNKNDILNLFAPYLLSTEDILGRDDLNNLIGLNKDIELKYYKLWLASTSILEKVLHNKIYNQSNFELEEIREQVKLYVQNNSFTTGVKIIKDHKYVIISGMPGIGKTTLARVLTLYLLSNEYEEFVYLNNSIDEGYEYFQEGKKQIFFFDDFLGRNFFESKLHPNEDNKIVKFINKIRKTTDKVLILTTREYILNQAKLTFEAFRIDNIEIAKCILDLDSYTNVIKAQILYNHLFFSNVPKSYLEDLIEKEKHSKIVKHPNYNPRLIETIIKRRIWESCESTEFSKVIKSYFDNPESVWLYAYENSLNRFSQYVLLVLLTLGTPVKLEALEEALISFLRKNQYKYQIPFDSISFIRSLKELENTFIKTQKDSYSGVIVEYQNPSIQDFLVNYLRYKQDLIASLLESFIFQEQLFSVFTVDKNNENILKKKICLNKENQDRAIERLEEKFSSLKNCRVSNLKHAKSDNFSWYVIGNGKYQFLSSILSELGSNSDRAINFVKEKFRTILYIDDSSYAEQSAYLMLLNNLDIKDIEINEEQLIDSFLNEVKWLDNFELFSQLGRLFPTAYKDTIRDESFSDKVANIVENELSNVEDSDLDNLQMLINDIESSFNIDLGYYSNELGDRIKDYEEYIESRIESYIEGDIDVVEKEIDEDSMIEEIFKSIADD